MPPAPSTGACMSTLCGPQTRRQPNHTLCPRLRDWGSLSKPCLRAREDACSACARRPRDSSIGLVPAKPTLQPAGHPGDPVGRGRPRFWAPSRSPVPWCIRLRRLRPSWRREVGASLGVRAGGACPDKRGREDGANVEGNAVTKWLGLGLAYPEGKTGSMSPWAPCVSKRPH